MDRKLGKLELSILWTVVVVVAIYFAVRLVDMVNQVHDRYPTLGVPGWVAIASWFLAGLILGAFVRRRCQKKHRNRACYVEGLSASALYFSASFIAYLLIFDNP